jgi:hypothetical protein
MADDDHLTPEQRARRTIDSELREAGWIVQNKNEMNLAAGTGLAVREFPTDKGPADYRLYVARKFIGAIEAKPDGTTLSGVEPQGRQVRARLSQPRPKDQASRILKTTTLGRLPPSRYAVPRFAVCRVPASRCAVAVKHFAVPNGWRSCISTAARER